MACTVLYSPQPAAELNTSKQGEKRVWGDRVLSGRTASHPLARAPGVASSHHCKRMRQHKPPGGRPTLWRRADGDLSAAVSPAVARARSKACKRAFLRLPRLSSVRGAACIQRVHRRTVWEREMATYSSHINAAVHGLPCCLRTMKDGAIGEAVILVVRELQRRQHAQELCTADSKSGRRSKERESSCTGISTAPSRWMDWRTILSRRTILTNLTNL